MSGRIRSIKPEWLDDELLVLASEGARVLSVALLLMADDYGNGRLVYPVLSARIFPRSPEIFSLALDELTTIRYIAVYQLDGQKYFAIRNWDKHQRVDKPGKPHVPGPKERGVKVVAGTLAKVRDTLAKVPGSLAPDPDLRPGPTTNDLATRESSQPDRTRASAKDGAARAGTGDNKRNTTPAPTATQQLLAKHDDERNDLDPVAAQKALADIQKTLGFKVVT